ncbi:MAG: enoyl-CoA hydratase-related protein [Vicinamibacterales bacterium]
MTAAFETLLVRRDGPVARVTLNRPHVRNAIDAQLVQELTTWATAAAADATLRCVVLDGAGQAFSAGADLAWMRGALDRSREDNLADAEATARLFLALDTLPVPLIGRVHGAALGGGAGLVAVCDVAVSEADAQFGFTEVRLGIVPAVISPYVLARIGRSAARAYVLTGRRFDAGTACRIGLVHAVAPAAQLDDTVEGYVADVLASGPHAVAAAKALIAEVWPLTPAEALGRTAATIADLRVSPEGQDGLRAFLEKRAPSWRPS